MRYGFVLPYGDARVAADFAYEAELAGWDGFFVWEPVWGNDAWVSLAAAAMRTQHIRLGTMLTPVSRMRPWKLASETVTLDHLSNGRVILAVGLGAIDVGFAEFGEVTDRKTRAELMDEGLDILIGLWHGQPFSYEGKHYHIKPTQFLPPPSPVQQPRIPIWIVGAWRRETASRRERSMQRALRYDGLLPNVIGDDGQIRPMVPEDVKAMRDYIATHRPETTPFDIVTEGRTPGDDRSAASSVVQPWSDAGATWWIEAMWSTSDQSTHLDDVQRRIRQGPPRAG